MTTIIFLLTAFTILYLTQNAGMLGFRMSMNPALKISVVSIRLIITGLIIGTCLLTSYSLLIPILG